MRARAALVAAAAVLEAGHWQLCTSTGTASSSSPDPAAPAPTAGVRAAGGPAARSRRWRRAVAGRAGASSASVLRELIEDTDPPGGFLAAVAQLLTVAARRAEQIEPDRDGDASCPLHEAAALITDNAGQRLIWAARALHPQGDI
ncbi:hypothetical protein ACOBQB_00060 [Streptomyces sp. G5(2025)]|uniref:hypothetical protein n=1 Tax=Streptomyces sp. G5(2025) TaxID=3406628 RepID=UPI003C23481D